MTNETLSEDDSSNQTPGSLAQLAKRKDAHQRLAEELHKQGYIYVLFGALDGLSLSYSMLKYTFDMLLAESDLSSSDEMHDWMLSPEGAAIAATSSITLIVFSMLANHFDDDDQNAFKRYIAVLWPYCRNSMKALKNAYKGLKSTLQVGELLGGINLSHLIVPVGLVLGGLSVINRLWSHKMISDRKEMMKANAKLFTDIKALSPGEGGTLDFTLQELDELQKNIKKQSKNLRKMALLSAAYGGVIDGLYLYVGILGLCSLAPPVLITMAVFCAIYFVACIATRVYEEYDFQRKLIISQTKVELAYAGKNIELLFAKLQYISKELSLDPESFSLLEQQNDSSILFEVAVAQFKEKQDKLRSLSILPYVSTFLAGIKNGLGAYGALSSVIFAVATVLSLTSTAFPPALLIACISLGMAFLIGFIAHSLIHTYRHHVEVEQQEQTQHIHISDTGMELADIVPSFKNATQKVKELQPEVLKTTLLHGMDVAPSPQFFFLEWFEVLRSFFSGFGKGSKAIDFTMSPLAEADSNGHYQETPVMLGFIGGSMLLHTLVLALRALARGFGRPPIDAGPGQKNSDTEIELNSMQNQEDDFPDPAQSPEDYPAASRPVVNSIYSFFGDGRLRATTNPYQNSPQNSRANTLFRQPIPRSSIIEEENRIEESTRVSQLPWNSATSTGFLI